MAILMYGQAADIDPQQEHAREYIGLAVLLIAFLFVQFLAEPFHRLFYLHDPRIQYPHAEVERVPVCMFKELSYWL